MMNCANVPERETHKEAILHACDAMTAFLSYATYSPLERTALTATYNQLQDLYYTLIQEDHP